MRTKKQNPAIERLEEKEHKDLDHDGEKGESAAHRAKVFGKGKAMKAAKKVPPMFKNNAMSPKNSSKKSLPTVGTGSKICSACKMKGKSSCSHM